jgi:ornithine carrier protein
MPIAGAMAENATLFLVCNQMQGLLRRLDPPPPISLSTSTPIGRPPIAFGHLAISAAVAGSCASFVLTPVELVKCKMQVQNIIPSATTTATTTTAAIKSPGPITITQQILKRDGFKGLWLGQTGTFIRETGGSAAWFVAFELGVSYFLSRRESRGERPPPANGGAREMNSGGEVLGEIKRERDYLIKADLAAWELMLSGAIAGVTYNVMLFPADCIKSAVQTEDELRRGGGLTGKRTSFLATGKEILKARGIRGLYQGCGLTALRAAPSSALIFYMLVRRNLSSPSVLALTYDYY